MALGAFLAGMLLAETEYRHQLEIVIRPFRDVLLGLFFITIGTLLDLQLLFRQLWLVLLLVVGLQLVKTDHRHARRARSAPTTRARRCAPASSWRRAASSASRCSR